MGLQKTMKALADPTRRTILTLLRGGSLTAGEIAGYFEMTLPAVSKHLSVLRGAGLVRVRREGKFIRYELNASVIEEALLWLENFRRD